MPLHVQDPRFLGVILSRHVPPSWSLTHNNEKIEWKKPKCVTAQLAVANCRLFQSNDYGIRRQSRPPSQAHAGGLP